MKLKMLACALAFAIPAFAHAQPIAGDEAKKLAGCIWAEQCGIRVIHETMPGGARIRAVGIRSNVGVEYHYFMTTERYFGVLVKQPAAGIIIMDEDGDGIVDRVAYVDAEGMVPLDPKANQAFQQVYTESLELARRLSLEARTGN